MHIYASVHLLIIRESVRDLLPLVHASEKPDYIIFLKIKNLIFMCPYIINYCLMQIRNSVPLEINSCIITMIIHQLNHRLLEQNIFVKYFIVLKKIVLIFNIYILYPILYSIIYAQLLFFSFIAIW